MTEKQIAWGKEIKSNKHLNNACDAALTMDGVIPEMVEKVREFLLNCDDAGFFIENRDLFKCHSEDYFGARKDNVVAILQAAAVAMGLV